MMRVMQMMLGWGPQLQIPSTNKVDSDSDAYSDSSVEALADRKKAKRNDENTLTSSVTHFVKLPTRRVQQVVEDMVPAIDAIATVECDNFALSQICWIVGGIKPFTRTCSFRVNT